MDSLNRLTEHTMYMCIIMYKQLSHVPCALHTSIYGNGISHTSSAALSGPSWVPPQYRVQFSEEGISHCVVRLQIL